MATEAEREQWRKYYQENKEAIQKQRKRHFEEHPEKARKRNRRQYELNAEYINTRNTERRQRLRELIQQQKIGRVCEGCGISDFRVLDFHHVDKNGKEGSIGKAVSKNWNEERILKEIAKCQVLCSNCHRILHWEERNGQ